ncbi:RNA exonuclease 3 [Malassezia vespertilionis]|uniref:RNA exonuclease 3 n=1 Tax=Malassezia vespertilionis TaxID=2020962 RepID=UPI0024B22A14|nr:RNA exonuclease 3 [Malassezia vespertilionis]WFD06314.1 RNA exonuclease 3 [Malassezia vespertilionis]
MFRPLGLLDAIVCPAHREGVCEDQRIGCPYSHNLSKLVPPSSAVQHAPQKRERPPTPSTTQPPKRFAARPVKTGPVKTKEAANDDNSLKCPVLTSNAHPSSTQISLGARQAALRHIFGAFLEFYQPLLRDSRLRTLGEELCVQDALAVEAQVFQRANQYSFRASALSAAVAVKKRNAALLQQAADNAACDVERARECMEQCTETGTNARVLEKRTEAAERVATRLSKERIVKAGFLCPKGDLPALGYMSDIPASFGIGGTCPDGTGENHMCARCSVDFRVAPLTTAQAKEACRFHPGRARREPTSEGSRRRVFRYSCCGRTVDGNALGDDRCATGPHVFKEEALDALHNREPFVTTKELAEQVGSTGALDVAALDCEMSYTTQGLRVTRITLVDEAGEVVFDEMVRCSAPIEILDLNTQFSGIHAEEYEAKAVLSLQEARSLLAQYIGPNTILIGHGLENDLRAIRLVHTNIVDTVQLFPHPRGLPYRMALRDLVSKHLGKIIQAGGAQVGHSSAEDAQMTLELVRWRWKHHRMSIV